ncbi:Epoxide hydrolase-like,Alpha/Beta hydrolase fold,Epoxide hydrolase, N-terminal [Cinara cedri]|uniref:Epoxide hydrolase n=1 Tax=Cinara cedri TaxID=506608 RepID=A0A5E4MDI3_9HEMI|nr:Epoxide hydrolase-like,Alpha/Beta hydrolase fold,Epoxide hydrolase, N-terminal [Cinara cedri]
MGKLKYYIAALTITVVALVVYRKTTDNVKPEVMTEDVWWGRQSEPTSIDAKVRPFQINITDKVTKDLKNRLSNIRPLVKPLENINFEYGFNSDHLMKIIDHWLNRYDWTARQAYLNTMPQYKTRVYGLDLHFIHAKPRISSSGKIRTLPLLMLHGWPGSVVEFYKIIPMLTEPKSGDYDFVFEVIAPSLPGYGFSDAAVKPGMGPAQIGQVFVKLMERLGHKKFYVHGGDWGAVITDAISKIFPDRVYGMHSNMCTASLTLCDFTKLAFGTYWPSLIVSTETEKSKIYPLSKLFSSFLEESGYMHLQMTKPDTAGVALNDSPVGLAAYILEKFTTWTNAEWKHLPDGGLSKYNLDELLDNVMIYWVTNSMTTSMRLYSEFASKKYQSLPHINARVQVPAACALFPNEMPMALQLKKLLQRKYINLISSTEMKEGGHFAAFEQPKLLSEDIWSSIFQMETIKN